MKKTLSLAWVCSALLLTACDQSMQPAPAQAWYGMIRNTCGTADGPALTISLDTAFYQDCDAYHDGEYQLYKAGLSVDSLKAGQTISLQEPLLCALGDSSGIQWGCGGSKSFQVTIGKAEAERMELGFVLKTAPEHGDATVKSGTAILFKCRAQPKCG